MSYNPLDCFTAEEMHPVLRTLCGDDDFAGCLARLLKGGETDTWDWTKAPFRESDQIKGKSMMHIDEFIPSLCEQLTEAQCHDYGQGTKITRCRWMKDEHSDTSKCGIIEEAWNPKDRHDSFYVWRGGLERENLSWDQELPPGSHRQLPATTSHQEKRHSAA
jgi:hypothetical protein